MARSARAATAGSNSVGVPKSPPAHAYVLRLARCASGASNLSTVHAEAQAAIRSAKPAAGRLRSGMDMTSETSDARAARLYCYRTETRANHAFSRPRSGKLRDVGAVVCHPPRRRPGAV